MDIKKAKVTNKKIYIATNFLESMIENNYPTRAEINDIFNAFETGAAGIVLAAETAIGRYPEECINLVKRIHTQYLNFKKIIMKIVAIIPIKSQSKRVKGKNFKLVGGKPLYRHLLDKLTKTNFDEIYIDSDSKEIENYCRKKKYIFLKKIASSIQR